MRLFGWETDGSIPKEVNQAILIFAPHTSYWDFVIGRMTYVGSRFKIRVLIKKEVFFFPLGPILKLFGAIPVARGKKNNMVDQVKKLFVKHPSVLVLITPEGSRKLVKQWKKGFYLIAMEAQVPIALSFIDYRKKTGGVGPIFYPTGDFEKDMELIYNFYKDKTPRHPEKFFLPEKFFPANNRH